MLIGWEYESPDSQSEGSKQEKSFAQTCLDGWLVGLRGSVSFGSLNRCIMV